MDNTEKAPDLGLKFLGLFILYALLLFSLLLLAPPETVQRFKELTASGISSLWRAFSVPLVCSGLSMHFLGFPMEMTLECTAIHYFFIAVAAILAYPFHRFRYKAFGILFMSIAVFLLNALRICVLGIVGRYERGIFDFVHTYLWQGTFALVVFLLWTVWERGLWAQKGSFAARIFLAFAGATVCYGFLIASLNTYASVLSFAANILAYPVSLLTSVPEKFIAGGGVITYRLASGPITNKISTDVMNSVVFAALMAGSADRGNMRLLLKRAGLGLLMLFIVHLLYVFMYGVFWANHLPEEIFGDILWITRGCSIAAPLLIWFTALKVVREPTAGGR